ncbi:MAG: DNA cytosine methyltransferase [Beijerinckiaceae bacterium]|nr:DNA cytosine methyltransferase [Beijerinckiaceae bacterium]
MDKPTYYEFFAGGGMARAGLGSDWRCLFANDFDPKKGDAYRLNWGDDQFKLGDIHQLTAKDLPGRADLAWASFPCQDLSLAGNGKGLSGQRSGAFWGFQRVIEALPIARRPKLLVIENVIGALTSNNGADFVQLNHALSGLGYLVGALTIDAVHFLPQSRPRLFIVCVSKSLLNICESTQASPSKTWHSSTLVKAVERLPESLKSAWRWWRLPPAPLRTVDFSQLVEEEPKDVAWHTAAETARLMSMMSEANLRKLAEVQAFGKRAVGTIYRRTRMDAVGEKIQRAEVRFDGVAGCLRTPSGGSSRQFIIVVKGGSVKTRLLSGREAARLMGLPDGYILPKRYNDAYHLLGDGLAVPAVTYLQRELLLRFLGARTMLTVAAE